MIFNKSRIPDVYFAYSEKFDYRKYLEEKSHTDEIVLAVDRSTEKIIGSTKELASRFGEGAQLITGELNRVNDTLSNGFSRVESKLDNIDETLQSGFNGLSIDISRVSESINDLSIVCGLGFERLTTAAVHSNELLNELVTLIQTPDQVWAREQFENAKTCISRGLWEDALNYANKSISGDDRHSGFHIEPTFHYLKGQVLLQYPQVGKGGEFLDLALSSFNDAIKYCGSGHSTLMAQSHLQASWCHYCKGAINDALKYIQKSIKFDSTNPLALFLESKYYANMGNYDAASNSLRSAILKDELLFVRAQNDADFLQGLNLDAVSRSALRYRQDEFDSFLKHMRSNEVAQIIGLASELSVDASGLKAVSAKINEYGRSQTLASLNNFFMRGGTNYSCEAAEMENLIKRNRMATLDSIKNNIKSLKTKTPGVVTAKKSNKYISKDKYFLPGMAVMTLAWWLLAVNIFSSDYLIILLWPAFILGFFTYGIGASFLRFIAQRKANIESDAAYSAAKAYAQQKNAEETNRVAQSHARANELEQSVSCFTYNEPVASSKYGRLNDSSVYAAIEKGDGIGVVAEYRRLTGCDINEAVSNLKNIYAFETAHHFR